MVETQSRRSPFSQVVDRLRRTVLTPMVALVTTTKSSRSQLTKSASRCRVCTSNGS